MKHLTLHERMEIERHLASLSLRQIASLLGKHPSTISREIKARRVELSKTPYGHISNFCRHRLTCQKKDVCLSGCRDPFRSRCSLCPSCNLLCPEFEEEVCAKLLQPPYVCNPCSKRHRCVLRRFLYQAKKAHQHYITSWSQDRSGYCLTGEQLQYIDSLVSPRIKQGQSLYAIAHDLADQLPCSITTLYRLVDDAELDARNIDLPRKVTLKPSRPKRGHKIDKTCRIGRTLEDYALFLEEESAGVLVEMDTIEGTRGGAVLLSLRWPDTGLHLIHLREANTARSVKQIFEEYYQTLGHENFERIFGILLTDNGSEFSNPTAIEFSPEGIRRTHIFYCDPASPQQKPSVERGHGELRRILPKGTSFNRLTHQQVRKIQNHLNSYPTKKLNGAFPYAAFSQRFGSIYAEKLGWSVIEPASINLTPRLLTD